MVPHMMTRLLPAFFCVLLLPVAALASSNNRNGVSADYVNILEGRIQMLEEQVKSLTNQVEQANYQARTAQERLARVEEDVNTRFRMIEGGSSGATTSSAAGDMIPDRAPGGLTPEGTARANPDTQRLGQLTEGEAPVMPNDPNLAYDQAFQKVRAGDYEAAESALRAFVQKWPKSELSSNASYWLGETYYVRGDYPAAAKAFAQGFQAYPKGAKAEDTLLKLALTLGSMGRAKDACVTLDQLTAEFPRLSSTNRRRVEQERTELECSTASKPAKPGNRAN